LLARYETVYARFEDCLNQITRPEPGEERQFIDELQRKLDEQLENGTPPDAPMLELEL
jgi:hypothetical protein